MVAGPDRHERQNTFLEPLELEDLESRPQHEPGEEVDPDVFERVTAVPGELDAMLHANPPPAPPPEDDGISGLFERATPVPGSEPALRHPTSEPPPVLSAPPASSDKRPARRTSRTPRPSRPGSERPARRPSSPHEPAIELDLEAEGRPVTIALPDALEMELPTPNARLSSGAPGSGGNDPEVVAMKDRYATGDFSGALIVAEGILEAEPQHEEARRCRERCTDVLSQMYLARLGSLAQIVQVALSGDEIRWLSLDHRAGFLLSLIDGASSIETLLDISGMPRLEALRILYGLLDQRVIALSEGQ
jgi:hypothetical protein